MARVWGYELDSLGGVLVRFHHVGLEVGNFEESVEYYKQLFNLEVEDQFSFLGEEVVFLATGDFRLELVSNTHESKETHICFEVENLQNVMKQFRYGRKIEGPFKLENGWETVFYEGPNQEIIEFLQIHK